MRYFYSIIKADYLQRTRSYSFLITLALTVFMAYCFVPKDTASYTTLSAAGYKGVYNSAWAGYVSAIMTTVMLSFYGFMLVNSGIKKDIDTEVGLIVATTPISNFRYLLCKQLSNFLVLLSIAGTTFLVSILVFVFRGTGYPFILGNFVFPYLFFAVPALFVVASLAVSAEVYLGKRSMLQVIVYFFLFGICMALINSKASTNPSGIFDPFGLSLITKNITQHINTHFQEDIKSVSFGFIFNGRQSYKTFVWEGLNWSALFIFSRMVWIAIGFGIVYGSSLSFHRFDLKQAQKSKKNKVQSTAMELPVADTQGFSPTALPVLEFNYSIYPLIKTEFLLLIRQGNRWMWLLNGILWLVMCFVPFEIAYSYLLPALLFLQVTRWSELATKEQTNRIHYFTYASYKPLQRILPAQILAGIALAIALSLPIITRCALSSNIQAIISVVNGGVLIVLSAVVLGILTGGKKLFEILFFLVSYAVMNKTPVTDYLGSLPHENPTALMLGVFAVNIVLVMISFATRSYQSRHL